jgi:SAM-dependent methyltransferase
MNETKILYEQYHQCCPFSGGVFGSSTFLAPKAIDAYPDAKRVLDFGCGNGYAVYQMRQRGEEWFGIEISNAAYEQHLQAPYFYCGDLSQFDDDSFDMIYSTEVMEHIPEEEVATTVTHLCRIARNYIFMTISLRPSADNNKYHCTLKPREWWEDKFTAHGFHIDSDVVRAYQRVTLKSTEQILSRWAGLGEKCARFADNPPYELFGETQFWYFAFSRDPVQRIGLHRLKLAIRRQRAVPFLRRCLGLPTRSTGRAIETSCSAIGRATT